LRKTGGRIGWNVVTEYPNSAARGHRARATAGARHATTKSPKSTDRRRLQRFRRPPGQPRRHPCGGVAGAGRQAADGVDLSLGVLEILSPSPQVDTYIFA